MFGRDRFIQLESPVAGVMPALEVLDQVRGAPKVWRRSASSRT